VEEWSRVEELKIACLVILILLGYLVRNVLRLLPAIPLLLPKFLVLSARRNCASRGALYHVLFVLSIAIHPALQSYELLIDPSCWRAEPYPQRFLP
jgi:hypothetical protein